MNFTSSITLFFKDAFSSGFTQAQNSLAGMKGALGQINENQSMNRLAADLAMASSMTEPFRQNLSALMDEPSKLAGSFESSLKNIQAITGMTNAEIDALGGNLTKIGSEHAAGPLIVADAYGDVAGGITNFAAQLPVLNASLLLAEAGQADLGVATNGLVKILNSYNFSAGDTASVTERAAWASDVMTQAVGMGVGSMQEFVSAMAPISGSAASVGIGFDEIGSTMAYMTATTDTAATAGTKLESFMTALQKPSDMLSKALASVGITSGSAMLKQYGLAESARIVSEVFGGSSDLITQALGRQEAKAAVVSLMSDQYTQFAMEFGAAMQSNVTAEAAAVQNESYESKLGRMNAAMDALKLQTGDDINTIKGFFVDIGTGFLTNVVSPIMSSPVGGVFQGIAAGTGMLAKGVLDLGGSVLNTAAQLAVLTSTIQNAGGFINLFKNSISLLGSPLTAVGGLVKSFVVKLITMGTAGITGAGGMTAMGVASGVSAAPMSAATVAASGLAAAVNAVLWPVLAVIGAIAAVGFGVYMLIKHWDAIKAKFVETPSWVLAVVSVFIPFIGIPALIIKHWDTIKAFFVGLWVQVKTVFTSALNGILDFITSDWVLGVVAVFLPFIGIPALIIKHWDVVSVFFVNLWNGITDTVASVTNWFSGVWTNIAGRFASAWMWVKDLFTGVWDSIKGIVLGFVEWLSPVIDAIIAPFKAIGNVISGIVGGVKNWFGDTVDTGKTELAKMAETKAVNTSVPPISQAAPAVPANNQVVSVPALTSTGAVSIPAISAVAEPISATRTTSSSGGNILAVEHFAAASRKGIAGDEIDSFASDAFISAGSTVSASGIDLAEYENEAQVAFAEAMRPARQESLPLFWQPTEERIEKKERPHFSVQNLYLQSEDIEKAFDLYRQLEMIFANPTEAAV